jgi:D-serine dehydratase
MNTVTSLAPLSEALLRSKQPFLWINESRQPITEALAQLPFGLNEVLHAEHRLEQFAPLLALLFPELSAVDGIIESELYAGDRLQRALRSRHECSGRWFIKADHALPVAGSIKARGGIYEVLLHAEELAIRHGVMKPEDDRRRLASPDARRLFAQHQVAVGSTGNLGLSIGIMAAALGFQAVVHMSSDAKAWKKQRLRARGVTVVEHEGDFGAAVAAGREQAQRTAGAYFVDDESSVRLFLGYSVAALRLAHQLSSRSIVIDAQHPLFVYLPCGVGGAPGGITFGLRHVFGDHIHCFFAEPVASPCMLIRLATLNDVPASVGQFGLDNRTDADGLAVGQASELSARLMRPLASGVFTARDDDLFEDLYLLEQTEGLQVEPSAAASVRGPQWLESEQGRQYLQHHAALQTLHQATHILWTTGGAFVPADEYRLFHERGRRIHAARAA